MCNSVVAVARQFGRLLKGALGALVFASALGAGSGIAVAATPAAGTSIGNQASASYTDASGIQRSVTSNVVTAVVQQVASLTLTQNASKTVVAGGQVTYPLTLTNTGNGTDTFAITSAQSGAFTGAVVYYADANGDGIPDNSTPITSTGALAQGGVFQFVAVVTAPTNATTGQVNNLVVTATSGFAPLVSASVTETTTITSFAVINLSKSMSAASGAPNGVTQYDVTLSYSNTGNSAATNVTLVDVLPTGMAYVLGSGRWSTLGATALTDAAGDTQGTSPNTIAYQASNTTDSVTATVATVAAGSSGVLTFKVTIDSYVLGTGPYAGVINNTANVTYGDGSGATIGPVNSNAFAFTVTPVASVTLLGTTVAAAAQGSTVVFNNVLTNTGNTTDTFEVSIGTGNFPAGTTYALYKSDGVTPMLDTNGDGTVDTGPLASGAIYTVVLKATLPTSSTGGPFTVNKSATSKIDPTKTQSVVDTLTVITANSVDLTNNLAAAAGVPGFGTTTAGESTPQVTNTVAPGATTRFTLVVNNTSGVADTYNLSTTGLPAGWTVVFKDATGAVITNSGVVNGGANTTVFADVTVPANALATPDGTSLYFSVLSPTSGATDVLRDAVVVQTVRNITLSSVNSGQVFPGGSVVYQHSLANLGNVTETNIGLATIDTLGTFSSVVYVDVNNNGVLDSTDTVTTTIASLAPGATVNLLVKVNAIAGAAIGTLDVTTLNATVAGTINGVAAPTIAGVTDSTTVIAGNLALVKEQALDEGCDGTADGAFSNANITTGAVPGACIVYRITVTNQGTANATGIVVSDATPANTVYNGVGASLAAVTGSGASGVTTTSPANGAAGTVSTSAFALSPSGSVVLSFGVKINAQ